MTNRKPDGYTTAGEAARVREGKTGVVQGEPVRDPAVAVYFDEPPAATNASAPASGSAVTIAALQAAHVVRQEEWCPDQKPDLSFRGNEMAGEVGEACNVIKKLERERHGWRGSRATIDDLGDELADTIHTAILCAITAGIENLEDRVTAKFNKTSEKNGLSTRLCPTAVGEANAETVSAEDRAEQYIQAAVDRAPEPLRRLGEWLANKLDEDDWKTAERMLLGAATARSEGPVPVSDGGSHG